MYTARETWFLDFSGASALYRGTYRWPTGFKDPSNSFRRRVEPEVAFWRSNSVCSIPPKTKLSTNKIHSQALFGEHKDQLLNVNASCAILGVCLVSSDLNIQHNHGSA